MLLLGSASCLEKGPGLFSQSNLNSWVADLYSKGHFIVLSQRLKRLILKIRINNWCTVRLCDQVLQSVQSESIDCPGTSTARPVLLHTQDDCSISKSMPASMLGPQLLSSLTMVVQHQQKQEETRKHGTPGTPWNTRNMEHLVGVSLYCSHHVMGKPALRLYHLVMSTQLT